MYVLMQLQSHSMILSQHFKNYETAINELSNRLNRYQRIQPKTKIVYNHNEEDEVANAIIHMDEQPPIIYIIKPAM